MNKIIAYLSGLILVGGILPVWANEPTPFSKDKGGHLNKSEFRAAAFVPTSERFRHIYGDVGTSLQVEQTRTWKNHRYLELWGNLEWIFMDGKGRPSCGSTGIDILNLSLGLKTIGKVYRNRIFLYAGIGPDVGFVFIENKLSCCQHCDHRSRKKHENKVSVGGIVKSGAQFYFGPHFYLDLFVDYLYIPISFHKTVDLGGLKSGVGLGGRF